MYWNEDGDKLHKYKFPSKVVINKCMHFYCFGKCCQNVKLYGRLNQTFEHISNTSDCFRFFCICLYRVDVTYTKYKVQMHAILYVLLSRRVCMYIVACLLQISFSIVNHNITWCTTSRITSCFAYTSSIRYLKKTLHKSFEKSRWDHNIFTKKFFFVYTASFGECSLLWYNTSSILPCLLGNAWQSIFQKRKRWWWNFRLRQMGTDHMWHWLMNVHDFNEISTM